MNDPLVYIVHTLFNPFHATGLFQYPLKISEIQRCFGVFMVIERDEWCEMD